MSMLKRIIYASSLVVAMFSITAAQDSVNSVVQRSSLTITAGAFGDRIRITAPASVVGMHVKVYAASGEKVLDQEIKSGNVFDWQLQSGNRLPAGRYVCVVTARSISGRLTQRLGAVNVDDQALSVEPADSAQLSAPQAQAIGLEEENSSWTVLGSDENRTPTVIAHDGTDGQLTRGRGALTFGVGDFFSGEGTEQMRLTEAGDLGIGTDKPKAKLDVAGMISAREGLMFADGSTLNVNDKGVLTRTTASGEIVPNIAGTGTQNKLAKWTDNAGTLGDSGITENAAGLVGIGTTNPQTSLQVGPNAGYGATTGLLITSNLPGTQFDRAFQLAPRQTANPATNSILMYVLPTVNAGVTVPTQYGLFLDGKQGTGSINSYSALATGQAASLGATNNTHLLMGRLAIPTGNYAIYDNTGFRNFFSGNVGIGTTNPAVKLDVTGIINASNYNLGGSRILSIGGSSVGNTFLGVNAGSSISPLADKNSFFGNGAGQSTTIAGGNSFFGASAGQANLTGGDNSFFGSRAGEANTTGDANSFFGVGAGDSNTTASGNSFFGRAAGATNGTGTQNSFFGVRAGVGNQTGTNNSFVGFEAGESNTTGGNNTLVGAEANVGSGGLNFATAIGAGATVSNSNTVVLGRSSDKVLIKGDLDLDGNVVGNLAVNGTLTVDGNSFLFLALGASGNADVCYDISSRRVTVCSSSLRYKTNVQPFSSGLNLIKRLRPVTFNWKSDNKSELGFIAEEVNEVEPLLSVYNDKGEIEGVKYKQVGVVLVNAVNELKAEKDAQVAALEAETSTLKKQLTTLQAENAALRHQNASMDARLSALELELKPKTAPQR